MIHDLQKILRNMPYTDMLLIASYLDDAIPDKAGQNDIAKALAALATAQIADRTDISKVEQDSLRKVFSRARSISVVRLQKNSGSGWQVSINGPYAANIVNADLKVALSDLLDTVAATAALKG